MIPTALQPYEAEVVENTVEAEGIFTLRLRFTDADLQRRYSFQPGQFNMLYLFGVGEVPISIVSDPLDEHLFDHTIRTVGRVTEGLSRLRAGDRLGIRGPYGRGWPMQAARGKDVVVVSGGLGCAPVMSVINYVTRRRGEFRHLNVVQGVKAACDLIWPDKYAVWQNQPDTSIVISADSADAGWPHHTGSVLNLFDSLTFEPANTVLMTCGPEGLMRAACQKMQTLGVAAENLWLSMERNMHCAVGQCGHCQFGGAFVCRDGPVFSYAEIGHLLGNKGV